MDKNHINRTIDMCSQRQKELYEIIKNTNSRNDKLLKIDTLNSLELK